MVRVLDHIHSYWHSAYTAYDHYGVAVNLKQFIKFTIRAEHYLHNGKERGTRKMHSMLTDICLLC